MPELADIFRAHWPEYLRRHPNRVLPSHRAAVQRMLDCRTAALGGRVYACPEHGKSYAYHSCNHRACPKCGNDKASAWLEKQGERLLPVPHFMAVFTLPSELRPLARSNQKEVYSLMFRCAWKALAELAANPRRLGLEIAAIAVLHTWGRAMPYHPHIHFLVPAGGFDVVSGKWRRIKSDWFIKGKALGQRFRTLVRQEFKKAGLVGRADPGAWRKDWVAHIERPESDDSLEGGLKYLAPYVFRTAISNKRILSAENGKVTFLHTPSGTREAEPMTLDALEFIGRFLQHVLPRGFVKVRYFGYYHHKRKGLVEKAREELGTAPVYRFEESKPKPCFRCPHCRREMELVGKLLPIRAPPQRRNSK
ncbi:MAG: transposase [Parvularcula sp.]|nr:transposase [Parvularcula sp.]